MFDCSFIFPLKSASWQWVPFSFPLRTGASFWTGIGPKTLVPEQLLFRIRSLLRNWFPSETYLASGSDHSSENRPLPSPDQSHPKQAFGSWRFRSTMYPSNPGSLFGIAHFPPDPQLFRIRHSFRDTIGSGPSSDRLRCPHHGKRKILRHNYPDDKIEIIVRVNEFVVDLSQEGSFADSS